MPHKRPRRVLLALLVVSVVIASGCRPRTASAVTASGRPTPAPGVVTAAGADQELTDTARLLAGLTPSPSGHLAAIATKPEWQAWQREFDREWTQATQERFQQMGAWRDRELKAATGACSTLMYPFSGPDILNALMLFPDCQRYVLFGLEQPGSLPALDRLTPERLSRLLEETRHALRELLDRNYFITTHMLSDTAADELHGLLPLMAVFLVRMDAELVSARDIEVGEDGQLRPRTPPSKDRRAASAVEIVFARPGHARQSVVYFRAQAEDRRIRERPGVVPFLRAAAPFPTFLKSASYLLHSEQFSTMRRVLLQESRLILEDDSGVPLRFLRAPEWNVTLFGKYSKPVKSFNYGYQVDMAKAYADQKSVRPLTFSFGYHWEAGAASVVLAVKSAVPAS
jgi:hypothetical protein